MHLKLSEDNFKYFLNNIKMDDINIWIIFAQIINFWILFFVFRFFIWDKLTKALQDRRIQLEKLDNVNLDIRAKLEEAEMNHKAIIEDARKKAWELEKNSEKLAKKNKEKILEEAESQAIIIIKGAEKNIEKERLNMLNSIKSRVIDLSLKLNEKLFNKELVNKDFMEKEINSINI